MERITGLKSEGKKELVNDKLAPDTRFYLHIPANGPLIKGSFSSCGKTHVQKQNKTA